MGALLICDGPVVLQIVPASVGFRVEENACVNLFIKPAVYHRIKWHNVHETIQYNA